MQDYSKYYLAQRSKIAPKANLPFLGQIQVINSTDLPP